MTNAFEYGDALLPQIPRTEGHNPDAEPSTPPPISSNQPYLNLATSVYLLSGPCSSLMLTVRCIDSEWLSLPMKYWNLSSRPIFLNLSNCNHSPRWNFLLHKVAFSEIYGHQSPQIPTKRCSTCLLTKLARQSEDIRYVHD